MTVSSSTSAAGETTRRDKKSASTRRRILDATFDSLHEVGYARTTTSEVCRRAGVARGTLLHHFATTAELVTAAAEDIFRRRLEAFREGFAALPPEGPRGARAIEMLWEILSGPTYYAWLEILVAARTDDALNQEVRGVMRRFGHAVDATYAQMFPPSHNLPFDASAIPSLVFPLLNGLAVDRIHAGKKNTDRVVGTLKQLAEMAESMAYRRESI